MRSPFDYLIILVFILVQWRIAVRLRRAAARRFTGARLRAARAGIVAFDALVVFGYLLSWSEVAGWLGCPALVASVAGAGALGYLLTSTPVLLVYEIFQPVSGRLAADTDPVRRRVLQTASSALMAAPFVAMGYGTFIERTNFQVREVDIPFANLPPGLENLRILHLGDIHLSAFLSEAELARVIDMSRGLSPHLAVMTGDLISSRGDPLDACIRQLARLKTDAGVFGCLGNHERFAGAETYTAQQSARFGIRFLRMGSHRLRFGDATLNLAGVDYQPLAHKERYLQGAGSLIEPGAFNVMLSHNPDVFPVSARQGFDLTLSGHTHGGQVTVEILDQSLNAARFLTPYVYGLYRAGHAAEYVTRGIGTIAVPARIGAPPEISLLRLRKV